MKEVWVVLQLDCWSVFFAASRRFLVAVSAWMSAADFHTSLLSGAEVYHVFVLIGWQFYKKKKKEELQKQARMTQ